MDRKRERDSNDEEHPNKSSMWTKRRSLPPLSLSRNRPVNDPANTTANTLANTLANASAVDTTRPEQLQASVARLNQQNYLYGSSQSQSDGEAASSQGHASQSRSSQGQSGRRLYHAGSSSQGQLRHDSSHASSSSHPIAERSSSDAVSFSQAISSTHAPSSSHTNAEHSSSHASSSSYTTDDTGDATVSLPCTITVGRLSIDLSKQQNSSEMYANAFHKFQTSLFNESMVNCKRELMRYKLGVCSGPLQMS